MANILGLQFGHDGAAAIIKDQRLVAAINNERLSRKKKAFGVSSEMISYVLDAANLTLDDIELVAICSYIYQESNYVKILTPKGGVLERSVVDLPTGLTHQLCKIRVGTKELPAILVQHHIAHCASAFFSSSFEQSACLSVDASMNRPEACSLFAYGDKNKLHYLRCPGVMIGNAYSVLTEKLGIGPGLTKSGTTMALASFAEPSSEIQENWSQFAKGFYEREFQPSDAVFINSMWSRLSSLPPHVSLTNEESDSEHAQEIAANLQFIFEEALLKASEELFTETESFNQGNLCLSGGSFLNSNANMTLRLRSPFKDFHLFPACGDDGTAVGAALFACHDFLGKARQDYSPKDIAYLGRPIPSPKDGEPYNPQAIAEAISEGKIVAFCHGRSEFGPRALGNRSLLADPRNPEMKDIINQRVKHREWFRPFAPAVLSAYAEEWFEAAFPSPFMLYIASAKKPDEIPAVMHVDNTARLQTVSEEDNPTFYELLSAFHELTGVPILLNTSLNDNGEPLVETPEDARNFFAKGNVDILVLNDKVFFNET